MSYTKNIQLHSQRKPTDIHDRLYNNDSDCVRNTKSYFTSVEPNKNQQQKQDI